MNAPFLQIITRCYRRPTMLLRNMASIESGPDWVQTFLVDTVGRDVAGANAQMRELSPQLRGEYIWVLDDDDECIRPQLATELAEIAELAGLPDVVMVRMDHGPRGVLPDDAHWQRAPVLGKIGCSGFIVRREMWATNASAWGDHYSGDYDFIAALFAADPEIYWWDVVASKVQRISHGEPE